jgi:diguanylate cyclase (GGDEF)-like protein
MAGFAIIVVCGRPKTEGRRRLGTRDDTLRRKSRSGVAMSESSASPERVRSWQRQVLVALGAQLASIGFMVLAAAQGAAEWPFVLAWAPLSVLGSVVALLALQHGWSHRLRDPALTAPQMVWANLSTATCYALCGPLRGAVFLMLCLTLLFSIFALPARTVRWLALYTVGLFGAVMAAMSQLQPERYPPAQEIATFVLLVASVLPMALLATRMSELRERMGRQQRELAAALERIGQMATRDELTGLPNRRWLTERLEHLQRRAERGLGSCLAMVDVDHFKRINDTHGHAVGDLSLRHVAAVLARSVRAHDALGRWGGEEFLVAYDDLPQGAVQTAAPQMAQRLCDAVRSAPVPLPSGGSLTVTVSVGVALWRPGESIAQTLERADGLLYQAKAQGRDRVVADEPVAMA